MVTEQAAGAVRLDIACGKNKKPGFIGIDIWDGADLVCNLEQYPWPFCDNSVDEIFCSHYIEHVPDLVLFANELYRILKPGARATIIAPYYSSIRAWQDPTHVRAISENTFLYFTKVWREANRLDHYPIKADFEVTCGYAIVPEWRDKDENELEFAMKHYINVVSDIHVELLKKSSDLLSDTIEQAQRLWSDGRLDKAVEICSRLFEVGNREPEMFLMLAEYHFMQEDCLKAVSLFEQAIVQDTFSYQGHLGLLRALCRLGKDKEAAAHLEKLKRAAPGFAEEIEELFVCLT